jgi:hypothetical protein
VVSPITVRSLCHFSGSLSVIYLMILAQTVDVPDETGDHREYQMIDPEGFLWHNLACSVFNIKGDDGNE